MERRAAGRRQRGNPRQLVNTAGTLPTSPAPLASRPETLFAETDIAS